MHAYQTRLVFVLLLSVIFPVFAVAQLNETGKNKPEKTVNVQFCTLVRSPEKYSGKHIRVRGRIIRFIHGEILTDDACGAKIYLALPTMVKPKPAFDLVRNSDFDAYDKACIESAPGVDYGSCILTATFEGRFDTRFRRVRGKRVRVANGFGVDELMPMQIVIRKVSQVTVTENHSSQP